MRSRKGIECAANSEKEFPLECLDFNKGYRQTQLEVPTFLLLNENLKKKKKDSNCGFYPQPLGDYLTGKS